MTDTNNTHASILNRSHPTEAPRCVLVAGASGGIGHAFCQQLVQIYPGVELIRWARDPQQLAPLNGSDGCVRNISFELTEESTVQQAAEQSVAEGSTLPDWVFVATGWLHDAQQQPEKTYRSLESEHLLHAYALNAVGPALLVKALLAVLPKKHPLNIGILSARVGSISDNQLGGWHSYRASKAALNMLIKNYAIELHRLKRPVIITGLQPGTTATELSAPFQRNVPAAELQTPEYTASQLIKVMQVLHSEDSGQLFDFLGLSFAP